LTARWRIVVLAAFALIARPSMADTASRSNWVQALMQRDMSAIERLLVHQRDVDERTEDGRTALMLAAAEGDSNLVTVLLARGAAVNATNLRGGTPLMYAATAGDEKSVGLLLARGAEINRRARNGWTALTLASARGAAPVVMQLLANGANPNIADIYGWTPLMRATQAGHVDVVKVLATATNMEINSTDDTGKTALHHAAEIGSRPIVDTLLAHGALTSIRDRDNRTAYDIARAADHANVASALRPPPAR